MASTEQAPFPFFGEPRAADTPSGVIPFRAKPIPPKPQPATKSCLESTAKNSQQTSVLMRLDKDPLALLRRSYIAICDESHCAAMVLADLEYHQNRHLNEDGSLDWFQRRVDVISQDLFREYSSNSVRAALKQLRAKGFVESQTAPIGDNSGHYYRLNADTVNAALSTYSRRRNTPPPKLEGFNLGGGRPQKHHEGPLQKGTGPPPKTSGFLEDRDATRESSRSRAHESAASAAPDQKPEVDVGHWPESVNAIRSREHFPRIPPAFLEEIIAYARRLGLTDPQFAEALRRDGPALIQEHGSAPRLWGWKVAEAEVRAQADRDREQARDREGTPPLIEHPDDEAAAIKPTGKVRLGRLCQKHRIPVVHADTGVCVYCKPPDDPRVRAEAGQMVRRLTEEQPQGP